MTEKEKMLAGEWYDANYDKNLLDLRLKAEQSCYDFNNARPQSVEQIEALKRILGTEIPQGLTVLHPSISITAPTQRSEKTPLSITVAILWTALK